MSELLPPLKDEIHLRQPPLPSSEPKKPLLIFFVPGNPGVIEYYRVYLTHLYENVRNKHPEIDVHVYGTSLRGFEIDTAEPNLPGVRSPDGAQIEPKGPYDLEAQKKFLSARLASVAAKILETQTSETTHTSPSPLPVIFAGHSVGSWLILEVASSGHSSFSATSSASAPSSSKSAISSSSPLSTTKTRTLATLALFPTIYDIGLSHNGRILTRLLTALPYVSLLIRLHDRYLACLPTAVVEFLVRACTGMVATESGARITAAFLQSRGGGFQALWLARDEMRVIGSEGGEAWEDCIWGTGSDSSMDLKAGKSLPPAKAVFYWGRNDPWVAEQTRDTVIAARGQGSGVRKEKGNKRGAVMIIDEDGTDHAFCLNARESRTMAAKSGGLLEDIIRTL